MTGNDVTRDVKELSNEARERKEVIRCVSEERKGDKGRFVKRCRERERKEGEKEGVMGRERG